MDKVRTTAEVRNLWAVVGIEGRTQGPATGAINAFTRFRMHHRDEDVTDRITRTVFHILCRRYRVEPEEVMGSGRAAHLVYIRQLYCYLVEKVYNPTVSFRQQLSLTGMARVLAYRDHSTVIHSLAAYARRLQDNEPLPSGLRSRAADTRSDYERALDVIAQYCVAPND